MDGSLSLVFSASHSWPWLLGSVQKKSNAAPGNDELTSESPECHRDCRKPLTANRLAVLSERPHPPPLLPALNPPTRPFSALPNQNNEGKRNIGPKTDDLETVFNQHIPLCGAVVLEWADCRVSVTTSVCAQGRCSPQLRHTKTLGIFQLLSAAISPPPPPPPTASQKA